MRRISLKTLESILLRETAVIAPEDVSLLMDVISKEAKNNFASVLDKRDKEILRRILSYGQSNLDDINDCFPAKPITEREVEKLMKNL